MSKLKEIREQRMRESKRYTQAEMARVAGVSRPKYRDLERSPQDLTKRQAEALAAYLGCSERDIFL